jgi:hypothetical protein
VADLHPELRWTPTLTTAIVEDHFAANDWPVGLGFVMPWFRPTVGIALNSGVGELDATAAFEVYSQSAAADTVAIAAGSTVRTRHGLVLLTTSFTTAPDLSRVVVPGAATPDDLDPGLRAWAGQQQITIEPLTGPPAANGSAGSGGFTAALKNLADHTDRATASSAAKMIGYPTPDVALGNQHQSWRPVLIGVISLAFCVLVGLTPALLIRRRRRRRDQETDAPAAAWAIEPEVVNAAG